ncbi:hypothetical protein C8R46DRAFT_443052 [Mycena filopes]|nr:hypothetical protein C8R46DRAFT_443052 [Mycena filopes]
MYGDTWAYSSSALDPYLYYPDWEAEDDSLDIKAREDDERQWTAEEDMTVAHVWPDGGDTGRGIVHKHSSHLQIHITINTTPIHSRRGKGNLPHVFSACGLVYLDEPMEEDNLEDEDRAAKLDPANCGTSPKMRSPSITARPPSSPSRSRATVTRRTQIAAALVRYPSSASPPRPSAPPRPSPRPPSPPPPRRADRPASAASCAPRPGTASPSTRRRRARRSAVHPPPAAPHWHAHARAARPRNRTIGGRRSGR